MPFLPLDPDPGSGMGRKSASGSGIRDEQPGSYFLELRTHFFWFFGVKILKFFDADPISGMEIVRIRDPGWKKVGSGICYLGCCNKLDPDPLGSGSAVNQSETSAYPSV